MQPLIGDAVSGKVVAVLSCNDTRGRARPHKGLSRSCPALKI